MMEIPVQSDEETTLPEYGSEEASGADVRAKCLINHGEKEFIVQPGMRIAQLVVAPILQANFVKVEALVESGRGSGGFGHTGVH